MSLASPLGVHGSSPGSSKDLNPLETEGERLPLRLTLGDREGDAFDRAWRHFLNVAPVTDGAVFGRRFAEDGRSTNPKSRAHIKNSSANALSTLPTASPSRCVSLGSERTKE